jgi:perosamine synthetase
LEPFFNEIVQFIRALYRQPEGIIPLHAPVFMGNEKKYLEECIDSTFVSSVGKFVDQFEEKIAEYTGAKQAVACVNGTSALHMALILVGVERDTEVITQPLTFIATANAITYCSAKPVFLDVDKDTLGLSPIALKNWLEENVEMREVIKPKKNDSSNSKQSNPQPFNKATNNRISACIPMHTYGFPCRIDEIVEICKNYNIDVVEDAAESLGSFYKKQHTGTFGKIGVLSFNGNKIITTGGGGMLLFNDKELAKRAKHLTRQAKVPHPWEFKHDETGYNYRMPNINAAIGLAQHEKIDVILENKRKTALKYKAFFDETDIHFFNEPENSHSNFWLNSVIFDKPKKKDSFLKVTNESGVMTRPVWMLMNKLDIFKHSLCGNLDNSLWLEEKIVNIPSSYS